MFECFLTFMIFDVCCCVRYPWFCGVLFLWLKGHTSMKGVTKNQLLVIIWS